MIYTSYYARIRKFPAHMVPVSISRGVPKGYDGLCYAALAPHWETVSGYKKNASANPAYWEKWYDEQYRQTVLDKLEPDKVAAELQEMVGEGKTPVLVCYEKSEDFCHRKLVAQWFGRANHMVREATEEDFGQAEAPVNSDPLMKGEDFFVRD